MNKAAHATGTLRRGLRAAANTPRATRRGLRAPGYAPRVIAQSNMRVTSPPPRLAPVTSCS